ncbi:MAG: hypothetical protein LBN18_03530 [Dysgonamonadaceae bacterium]|jgi:hypothetical protein|nr:hypothetical protein [Dysgonamonadaceae bacterium]
MNPIIGIPVYKATPTYAEIRSLRQCIKVLGHYSICLIAPQDLNVTFYVKLFEREKTLLMVEYFDPVFFKSAKGYSRLLLTQSFYERFAAYDYLLIYQLDAYVFYDALEIWCSKGYDYVGAPWMNLNGELNTKYAGNGGFSLRKIQSFIDLFSHKGKILNLRGLICYHRYRGPLHKPWLVLSGLFGRNNSLRYFTEESGENEDLFYVAMQHKRGKKFKIPASKEAMFFSFEEKPSMLFQHTQGVLPFGCHAWEKHEYHTFWRKFIPI